MFGNKAKLCYKTEFAKPRGRFHRLPFGLHCASGRSNHAHGAGNLLIFRCSASLQKFRDTMKIFVARTAHTHKSWLAQGLVG